MEGERTDDPSVSYWEDDPLIGIIPRAMSQLFSRLHRQVSFSHYWEYGCPFSGLGKGYRKGFRPVKSPFMNNSQKSSFRDRRNLEPLLLLLSSWTIASPWALSVHLWRLVFRGQQEVYRCPCGVGYATFFEGGLDIASKSDLEGDRCDRWQIDVTARLGGWVRPWEVWLHV